MEFQYMLLKPSGDIYSVIWRQGHIEGFAGPLHYSERHADPGDFHFSTYDDAVMWANRMRLQGNWQPVEEK